MNWYVAHDAWIRTRCAGSQIGSRRRTGRGANRSSSNKEQLHAHCRARSPRPPRWCRDRSGRPSTATSSAARNPLQRHAPATRCTTPKSSDGRASNEKKNHRVSGISATALTRCAHQCPRAVSGGPGAEHPSQGAAQTHRRPKCHSASHTAQRQADRTEHGEPAAGVPLRALEPDARIPEQMPHAVQQMIEEREGPADEQRESDGGPRTRAPRLGSSRRRPPARSARSSSAGKPSASAIPVNRCSIDRLLPICHR